MEGDREKAELLNRTFASKFSDPNINMMPTAPDYGIDNYLSTYHVSEDLVRSILLQTNRNQACGPGDVSARIIHECAHELTRAP